MMQPGHELQMHETPHAPLFRDALQAFLFTFAKRFIAGQTLKETLEVVHHLNQRGFFTTLDYLGENVRTAAEAAAATEQNIIILRALKEHGLDLNISVKPTQLGLLIDRRTFEENLRRILATAELVHAFVRVDIEGSSTTSDTFAVIHKLKNRTTPLGAAVQAMLHRTPDDVLDLLNSGIPLRLCKGAYKESKETAYHHMHDIQRQYLTLAKHLLTSKLYHGFATHDGALIDEIKTFAKEQAISPDHFEFQMLYGMRPALQEQLKAEGWRVRIYVPFGRAWLPYVLRRLRERKENIWFVVKNIFRK